MIQNFLRADGVEAGSSQLPQSVLPVGSGNPEVVHGTGYVAEWFSIFEELIIVVIDFKASVLPCYL